MLCKAREHKTVEKLDKAGNVTETELWTYKFVSQASRAKHQLTAERSLPFDVGQTYSPSEIGLHAQDD